MPYIDPSMSLNKLILKQKKLYGTFEPISCNMIPNEQVRFNMKGFEHLYKDGRGHYRVENDAKKRLILLEHAPRVILTAKIVKKDTKRPEEVRQKKEIVY